MKAIFYADGDPNCLDTTDMLLLVKQGLALGKFSVRSGDELHLTSTMHFLDGSGRSARRTWYIRDDAFPEGSLPPSATVVSLPRPQVSTLRLVALLPPGRARAELLQTLADTRQECETASDEAEYRLALQRGRVALVEVLAWRLWPMVKWPLVLFMAATGLLLFKK